MMNVLNGLGWVAVCALMLSWLVCAQEAGEAADAPKAEARKKAPMNFFGIDAKPTDADTPSRETNISAKTVDFDRKEGVILFDENVLIDDAQFILRSDRLIVFLEGTNDVSQIMAMGNVNITNNLRYATCDKAVYTKENGQIVMTAAEGKQVRLVTSDSTAGELTGKTVTIWVDDERVQVVDNVVINLPGGLKPAEKEKKKPQEEDPKPEEPKEEPKE